MYTVSSMYSVSSMYTSKFNVKNKVSNFYKGVNIMIPKDPVMLLSYLNLKLRDFYKSLEDLCDDLDVSQTEIEEKLATIDYHYDQERNQFI